MRMARGRREEWSCAVCTLLNSWRDRRCAACNNERSEDTMNQPTEWTCGLCTLVNDWRELRCGACEHERPSTEPRAENCPSTPQRLQSPIQPVGRERAGTPSSTHSKGPFSPPTLPFHPPASPTPLRENSVIVTGTESPRQQDGVMPNRFVEEATPEDLHEAPIFDLLAFGGGAAIDTMARCARDERDARDPSIFHSHVEPIDLTGTTLSDRNGDPLARAGLDLDSNSDEDDAVKRKAKRLKRLKHESKPNTDTRKHDLGPEGRHDWECSVCTNINPHNLDRCDLCDTARNPGGNTRSVDDRGVANRSSKIVSASQSNTTLIDRSVISSVESTNQQLHTRSTFVCSLCTSINSDHLNQCSVCEVKRRTIRCSVCTSDNDESLHNCEVCESPLVKVVKEIAAKRQKRAIGDFASDGSTSTRRNCLDESGFTEYDSYGNVDDDFEDAHEEAIENQGSSFLSTPPRAMLKTGSTSLDFDCVEDISDGELPAGIQLRAQSKHTELKDFKYFLPVEEINSDYGCQIDYRGMFADSSRSKSYADRLQKRRRESQKRKRSMADINRPTHQGGNLANGKRKATKKSNKRETTERRASTGQVTGKAKKKTPKGQTRRTGNGRRSSAPQFNPGINHYNTIDADIGDEVTTMAWEGIGSAGYL